MNGINRFFKQSVMDISWFIARPDGQQKWSDMPFRSQSTSFILSSGISSYSRSVRLRARRCGRCGVIATAAVWVGPILISVHFVIHDDKRVLVDAGKMSSVEVACSMFHLDFLSRFVQWSLFSCKTWCSSCFYGSADLRLINTECRSSRTLRYVVSSTETTLQLFHSFVVEFRLGTFIATAVAHKSR